jgi:hypothetical protein
VQLVPDRITVTGSAGAIFTSLNGFDWEQQNSGANANLGRVKWCGNQFVVIGSEGAILTSRNGLEWTPQVSGTLFDVAWDGTTMVAVGWEDVTSTRTKGLILTSKDGVNWSQLERA